LGQVALRSQVGGGWISI